MARQILPEYPDLGIPALYLHDLTGSPESEELLPFAPTIHPASAQIIPKLKQIAPGFARDFSEKPHAAQSIPFRLITTDPVWRPQHAQSFIAVSYCWHYSDWSVNPRLYGTIPPAGWPAPISPSMLRGIISLRSHEEQGIWIDQICVDQRNETEKKMALDNFNWIYLNARLTVVLVEDFDLSLEEEHLLTLHLTCVGLLRSSANTNTSLPSQQVLFSTQLRGDEYPPTLTVAQLSLLFDFYHRFFKTRWFTRAWCLQEYQLCPNCRFLLAGHSYGLIDLSADYLRYLFTSFASVDVQIMSTPSWKAFKSESFAVNFLVKISERKRYGSLSSVAEVACNVAESSCSIVADKISILLNTTGLSLAFHGNVTDSDQCIFVMFLLALCAGDGLALGTAGPHLMAKTGAVSTSWLQLAHWIGDSRSAVAVLVPSYVTGTPLLKQPDGVLCVTFTEIQLNCVRLRGIPCPPSGNGVHRALKFFESCKELTLRVCRSPEEVFQRPQTAALAKQPLFRLDNMQDHISHAKVYLAVFTVAYFVDHGISWIVDATAKMGNEFSQKATQLGVFRESPEFWQIVLETLFAGADDSMLSEAEENRENITVWIDFALTGRAGFMITDPDVKVCSIQIGSSNRHGILYVPLNLPRGKDLLRGRIYLVIPEGLNTSNSLTVRRVWVLIPRQLFSDVFCLVAKGYLFGCGEVDLEDGYVESWPKVRVTGLPPQAYGIDTQPVIESLD